MPLTGQKTHNGCHSSPGFLSVKRKTVIRISLLLGWLMIALILMTATGTASYDNIKYFFWMMPVSTALLYLLYMNSKSCRMSKEEEIKSVLALVFTFVCLIMAFFASILLEH
ncbi:MAG: hypothetical protein QG610_1483 [Euryarchaeota archaeon]|nr:hypothetical protein [Euryarchaeota archaeon]